jgi:hypothetical protein
MKTITKLLTIVLVAGAFAACGDDTENNSDNSSTNNPTTNNSTTNNSTTNNATSADAGSDEDVPTIGDDLGGNNSNDGCDEAAALVDAWPLNDAVSTGDVTVVDGAATLDASAGGPPAAAMNPFVYFDLDSGAQVEITDLEAVETNTEWEIGMRRTAFVTNGGDYPGSVEVARLTGTSFDAVTAADIPADSAFVAEDPVDENCEVIAPASGFGSVESAMELLNPDTTSGSWYNYSMGAMGPSVEAYPDHVYIIRGTDGGGTYKLGFVSWTSGVYDIQWASLD